MPKEPQYIYTHLNVGVESIDRQLNNNQLKNLPSGIFSNNTQLEGL